MSNDRDSRAAARDRLRNLEVPIPLGRADRLRSRSPSPIAPGVFFPSAATLPTTDQFTDATQTNMAMSEQLAAIREELRAEIRREFRAESAATAAGIPDAIRRKPEIPNFDKDHIDIWIRRTEHAYTRAGISSINDKFAWLETKFPVGTNPRIDEFLYGDATPENWSAFLTYLRSEYGATKQQKASVFIDGLKREGRRPSQYAAVLDEKTKDVSIDDIKKEMLLREVPPDVRRMLQERIETLSFKEAAKIADNYFDAEGRPKHSSTPTSIHEVSGCLQESTISDEGGPINAIGRRPPPRQNRFPPQNPQRKSLAASHQKQGRERGANSARSQPVKREPNPRYPQKSLNLCSYHINYGNEAKYCEVGCARFDETRFPGNGTAGQR